MSEANGSAESSHALVSYSTLTGDLAIVPITVAEGFSTKYGVTMDAEFVQAGDAIAAVISGATQFAISDGVLISRGFVSGAPLRIVANFQRANPYAIYSTPDITTPEQLRGKTLAIGQIGDATDVSARIALKPYDLSLGTDVPVLPGGNSPGRFAALTSGQVAAAVLDQGVFGPQALAQGYTQLISIHDQAPPWIGAGLATTASFLQSNPNTVMAVLKGLLEGINFFADPANRDASMAVMAKDLNVDPSSPTVTSAYEYDHTLSLNDPDVQQSAVDNVLASFRDIEPGQYDNVDGSLLIDHSFINQIKSSGFMSTVPAIPTS